MGTTSLEALAGAQAVLGPAGGVGPAGAAVGSWLAALALFAVLARGRDLVRIAAVGATVAAVLAGPAPGGDLPVRVAVAVGVTAAGYGLARWRVRSEGYDRAADLIGLVAGGGAVAAVASTGPAWPPSIEPALVVQGLAIASAAMALVLVGTVALGRAPRWRGPGVWPTVETRRTAPAASSRPTR